MKTWRRIALTALFLVIASFAGAQSSSTVLVVANRNNANSMALADYYRQKRRVPAGNVLLLDWNADDNATACTLATYNASIATPIYQKIATLKRIDYIVLCRNLPYIISETQGSVDSALAGQSTSRIRNLYFGSSVPFSSEQFGGYLVTRLDGWSWSDAYALVDRSLGAIKGTNFVFDQDPRKNSNYQYSQCNYQIGYAASMLSNMGLNVVSDATNNFVGSPHPLAGYVSWGSNDGSFSRATFQQLTFSPGALVETLVSTSAQYLRYPGGSQSQIAQLIRQGVTGIKGYVAEPQASSTARADRLYWNYICNKRNLAESFYAASQFLGWRDVVIGDPLCAPYREIVKIDDNSEAVSAGSAPTRR